MAAFDLVPELIEDNSGNRLCDALGQALQRAEDSNQSYIERHEGALPDRAPEVVLKITVRPRGPLIREIVWGLEVKTTDKDPECIQLTRVEGGRLVTDARPGRQAAMHLTLDEINTVPTPGGDEE